MYEITGVTVSHKPPTLGDITSYYFQGRSNERSAWVQKPEAVKHVRAHPNTVYSSGGGKSTYVEVVANGNTPYLRTKGDNTKKDNLLSPDKIKN